MTLSEVFLNKLENVLYGKTSDLLREALTIKGGKVCLFVLLLLPTNIQDNLHNPHIALANLGGY